MLILHRHHSSGGIGRHPGQDRFYGYGSLYAADRCLERHRLRNSCSTSATAMAIHPPNVGHDCYRLRCIIGVAQAIAIIPGTSRSGITMTAARALGFERPEAARFAFLLAIPAIAALAC